MSALILVTLEWQGQGKESLHLLRQDAGDFTEHRQGKESLHLLRQDSGDFTEHRQVMLDRGQHLWQESSMAHSMIYPSLTQVTQGPRAKGKYGAGRGSSTCLESPPAWVT